MKRRLRLALLLMVICLTVSGCAFTSPIETLLTPPKLSAEQTAVYNALMSGKGGGITLKYPKSGDYRSAFVIRNMDEEETEEAIVFYETTGLSSETVLWMNFLDQQNGKWVSMYDISVYGTDIERVVFSEIGAEKKMCITVCYSLLNQSAKGLCMMTYENGTPTEIYKTTYSLMDINDLDKDGANELFLVDFDSIMSSSIASTYTYAGGALTHISSVALNPTATEYTEVTNGLTSDGFPVLVIDHAKSDGTFGSDAIICYGSRLVNVLYPVAASAQPLTRSVNTYTANLPSMDIDGDGIVEIGATNSFPAYENLTKPEKVNALLWYSVDYGSCGYTRKHYSYCSVRNDYVFFFPTRWEGLVTVTVADEGREVSFWQMEAGVSASALEGERRLLTIVASVERQDVAMAAKGFSSAGSSENGYYYIRNGESYNTLTLTADEMADSFRLID